FVVLVLVVATHVDFTNPFDLVHPGHHITHRDAALEPDIDLHQSPAFSFHPATAEDQRTESHRRTQGEDVSQHSCAVEIAHAQHAVVIAGGDLAHQRGEPDHRHEMQRRQEHCQRHHSRPGGHANGGCYPDGGGGGQSAHHIAAGEDHPGAEEADSGDDLCRDAGGVQVDVCAQHLAESEGRD